MIRTNSGDGHLYELAYPRFSLLNSRASFMSAVSKCAPEVFERLHDKPLKAYQESWLLRLKRKRRVDFWRDCCGVYGDLHAFDPDYTRGFSLLSGFQDRYARAVSMFFGDRGLTFPKDDHIAYYNTEIHPRLIAWLKSLEEWGRNHNLNAGWVFQWAFLKLDSYMKAQFSRSSILRSRMCSDMTFSRRFGTSLISISLSSTISGLRNSSLPAIPGAH